MNSREAHTIMATTATTEESHKKWGIYSWRNCVKI